MAETQRKFTVHSGGTSQADIYVDTGVVNEHGRPVFRRGSGGGHGGEGGEVKSLLRLDIPRDVQIAKWGLAGLSALTLAGFLFLLERIDTRFDRADDKIAHVSSQISDIKSDVAGMRVEMGTMSEDMKAVLTKLDSTPKK